MTVLLREFLTSGRLGPLVLGLSDQDVRGILGEPEMVSRPHAVFTAWIFGAIELAFADRELAFIGLYLGRRSEMPRILRIDGFQPTHRTTIEEFAQYVR